MAGPLFIAVDLGAGSGRVFLAGVDEGEFFLEEIHRFQYPPTEREGNLRWDLGRILGEIKSGLKNAGSRASELERSVASVGIDSWAVDYGLLDGEGKLIADPVCYRDKRTRDAMERVLEIVPRNEIFEKTGIQFQPFNTLYQLFSDSQIDAAEKVLLLPDLIGYFLTGNAFTEYTNATTTQMVDAATGNWDDQLIERVGVRRSLLQTIVPAGTDVGEIKPKFAAELGLEGTHIVAPATHDTGSAVAGAPLGPASAYISSGTWSLVGVELDRPIINEEAARLNFTNEGGVYGTFRFLKNVMGLWIFESCRREWQASGIGTTYDDLLEGIRSVDGFRALIFPDDPRFLNPPSMLEAIEAQLAETGQAFDPDPAAVSKVIFDSLAFRYASVIDSIETLTQHEIADVQILGGGGRNAYLNQMTANACGRPVYAGLTEATVVGNVLVQAVTARRFGSIAEARDHVRANVELTGYIPKKSEALENVRLRYAEIESKF